MRPTRPALQTWTLYCIAKAASDQEPASNRVCAVLCCALLCCGSPFHLDPHTQPRTHALIFPPPQTYFSSPLPTVTTTAFIIIQAHIMRNTFISLTSAAVAVAVAISSVHAAPSQTPLTLNNSFDECLSCATAPTCPRDPCSTNTPGGLLLLTQFWDYSPPIGPSDSWTIHGLWPDTCSGGYDSDCDPSRNSNNIASVLRTSTHPKAASTLDTMNQYWLALNGNDAQLWSHEWNKHGTCVSTLAPKCYSSTIKGERGEEVEDYVKGEDIVDFFTTTVDLWKQYNVFQALKEAGIQPSTTKRYTLEELHQATKHKWGKEATFKCRNGALNEAWIYFHTKGRSTTADAFVQSEPLRGNNRCPAQGIRYLPK